jgi:hypothetical protein
MAEMVQWLKNSICGIVILGAVGSIAAYILMAFLSIIFKPIIKWLKDRLFILIFKFLFKNSFDHLSKVVEKKSVHLIISFYTMETVNCIFALFICTISTFVLILHMDKYYPNIGRLDIILPTIISFTSIIFFIRSGMRISLLYLLTDTEIISEIKSIIQIIQQKGKALAVDRKSNDNSANN